MSGGVPKIDIGGGDKRGGSGYSNPQDAQWDPFPDQEAKARRLAAQRLAGIERDEAARAQALLPPDVADIAMRDATTGRVRRTRGGSTRQSILGQAMEFLIVVGVVGTWWVRAVLRGDVW